MPISSGGNSLIFSVAVQCDRVYKCTSTMWQGQLMQQYKVTGSTGCSSTMWQGQQVLQYNMKYCTNWNTEQIDNLHVYMDGGYENHKSEDNCGNLYG